ncbi:hypothetical protein KG088_19175 [Halomonas sp. TRM85114]|uniref:hypothetical protein n=1 Tax=Halomonas jincaotanensis TaxID=2810616 RepID=UPI001BD2C492|nr:hypothetical protein [Halomonas jincaotanensis]MBS9405703.1 hypothetical protein [Halomonas jincaotanensis]
MTRSPALPTPPDFVFRGIAQQRFVTGIARGQVVAAAVGEQRLAAFGEGGIGLLACLLGVAHRDDTPKAVARKVVKTEFLAEKVKGIVGNTAIGFIKAKPRFSKQELNNIGNFLIKHIAQASLEREASNTSPTDALAVSASVTECVAINYYEAAPEPAPTEPAPAQPLLSCKKCGESHHLYGMYGQYGYYVKCTSCNTNTSMKQPCPVCGWKSVRIAKEGPTYTATCKKCEHQFLVYRQG